MALRFPRTTTAVALALSLGLVGLPACKKKSKPAEPDTPAPETNAGPGTNAPAGASTGDPDAPRGPFFNGPTEAPMRTVALENMKQIGLALTIFQTDNGALPAGYADPTGQPGLSWRVALLPYLDQDPLYRQFKLNEPWDSPNNKLLIARMPKMYSPPNQNTRGYTFCRGFTGPNTWLPPQTGRAGQMLLGVKTFQISGGLSNTILVAEAAEAVIWTKPDEVPFAPNAAPKLGGVFRSGFAVLMADGSTKFVRNTVSPAALADAIQINSSKHASLDE